MHRYEEIRDELLRRINEQIWPIGTDLPDELQLADEFKVARGTVRRALAELVDQGLIERRKRAGTRVVGRKGHASRLHIPIVRHDIEARGHRYGYRLLHRGPATTIDLTFPLGTRLWHVSCLHYAGDRPFQFEDRVINLNALPEAETTDFSERSPNEWLVERVPYTAVRTRLFAARAGTEAAQHLEIEHDAPVFAIERRTFLDNVALTRVIMRHPAVLFDIVTEAG